MEDGNEAPTDEKDAYNAAGGSTVSRRQLLQVAGAGVVGTGFLIGASRANDSPDRLEVVAHHGGEVEYTFTCGGSVERVSSNSFVSAEADEDVVTENDDGTQTATGYSADGYGDAFELGGPVHSFRASAEEYTLYLNGSRISREDLVQVPTSRLVIETPESGSVEYTMTTSGEITKILDNGDPSAEPDNDSVTENDDGSWTATGLTGNGHSDTFDFAGEVLDFSPLDSVHEGEFHLYLDGVETTPLELVGEERLYDREHSYSFEGKGDTWADVYLEVEDEGRMVPSTLDGATINPGYFWISDDGTKAAARVFPDDRAAFQFDNLVLDVTIDGTADAYVDGNESSLDWYPQPGATGDGWKGGFSWQEDTTNDTTTDSLALGGGSGYDRIITSADADYKVNTAGGLQNALGSASSGDIVFVAGDATIDTGGRSIDVPSGVTLASNRGENDAPGALLHTEETPQIMLRPKANARVTGLRLRGLSPGETVTWEDGISFDTPTYAMRLEGDDVEVDNCEVWGWPDRAIYALHTGAYVHHNYIYDNNGQGLGYGVAAADDCLIEYNYFHNNRHSVTAAYDAAGYTARYNHFSPVSVMHITDIHDPVEGDTIFDANIVENGETRTWDANDAEGLAGYSGGFNGGSLTVTDSWYFDESTAYDDGFAAVSDSGNVYGDEGTHDPADVIPGHPGMADRPWV